MFNLDGFGFLGSPAALVTAIGVFATIALGVASWRRTRKLDAPRAYLDQPEPGADGLVESDLVLVNPSGKDLQLGAVVLVSGAFAGEALRDGMGGVVGYQRGTEQRMEVAVLVPAQETRNLFLRFHADQPGKAVRCVLVHHGDSCTARLSAGTQ